MENDNSTQMLSPSALAVNEGQITGLPRNPRLIRDARFEKLKQSLRDSPEFMNLRPVIAVSQGDGKPAVVICGNMRLRACLDLGWKEVPTIVLPSDTPVEKLREYAIKDNVPYGETDWDILANEWDTAELADWGVNLIGWSGDEGRNTLPDSLRGEDIDPDELPEIEGDDDTAKGRVIITYPKGREGDVANLLGLESVRKVVYDISELPLAGD